MDSRYLLRGCLLVVAVIACAMLSGCQDCLGIEVPVSDQDIQANDAGIDATTSDEICDDGVDNDGDSNTDCADTDCLGDPACPELCDDGIDNDGDNDTDCADADCMSNPSCATLFVATGARGVAGSLFRVDPATAETTEVGQLTQGYTALAFLPDGRLLGAASCCSGGKQVAGEQTLGISPRTLSSIDPSTGTDDAVGVLIDSKLGPLPIADMIVVGGRLFGQVAFGPLVEIDPANGMLSVIGGGSPPTTGGNGLAADAEGNVFYITNSPYEVFSVDITTGELTSIGALDGVELEHINAMTFHAGTLYAVARDGDSPRTTRLMSIDLGTLTATDIGPLPPDIDAIASTAP